MRGEQAARCWGTCADTDRPQHPQGKVRKAIISVPLLIWASSLALRRGRSSHGSLIKLLISPRKWTHAHDARPFGAPDVVSDVVKIHEQTNCAAVLSPEQERTRTQKNTPHPITISARHAAMIDLAAPKFHTTSNHDRIRHDDRCVQLLIS